MTNDELTKIRIELTADILKTLIQDKNHNRERNDNAD